MSTLTAGQLKDKLDVLIDIYGPELPVLSTTSYDQGMNGMNVTNVYFQEATTGDWNPARKIPAHICIEA